MNTEELRKIWLEEQACAQIHGWDFSHLDGRWTEEAPCWDYRTEIERYRTADSLLLDQDTGGGEFLLSLKHPYEKTAATENYPPNIRLCRETLLPLGIDFRAADAGGKQPFADESFDLILNRHGDCNPAEAWRMLKRGGVFLTEQVGEQNDRELAELLLPGLPLPYPGWNLSQTAELFCGQGFRLLNAQESFRKLRFFDTGAVVWFARIIEWEFPGFSVERCFDRLLEVERMIAQIGFAECRSHRFLLTVQKP